MTIAIERPLEMELGEPEAVTALGRALNWTGGLSLVKKFTGGKSGAQVLLVQRSVRGREDLPFILKVAHPKSIIEEIDNYEALQASLRARSVFAELKEPKITRDCAMSRAGRSERAALFYEPVDVQSGVPGAVEPLSSILASYLESKDNDWSLCEELLRNVLMALPDQQVNATQEGGNELEQFYLRKWFPNIKIDLSGDDAQFEGDDVIIGDLRLQKKNKIAHHELRQQSEASVMMPRFIVVSDLGMNYLRPVDGAVDICLEGSRLTVVASLKNASRSLQDRVHLARNFVVSASSADSRYYQYKEQLKNTFDGSVLSADRLLIGHERVEAPNPLSHLSSPFEALLREQVAFAPGHGDLHAGNVLIVGKPGTRRPVIIDYGLSSPKVPVGSDFVRLFGWIVREIVALTTTIPFEVLQDVLLSVFGDAEPEKSLRSEETTSPFLGPEERAYRLLRWLWREGMKRYGENFLFHQVYGFSLVALKWHSDYVESYAASYLLGALALKCINEKCHSGGKPQAAGRAAVRLLMSTRKASTALSRESVYAYLFDRLHQTAATTIATLNLPAALEEIKDVLDVVEKLISSYADRELLIPDTRIYFAYLDQGNGDQSERVYRIGLSTSQREHWRAGIIAGSGSNIHAVYDGVRSRIVPNILPKETESVDLLSDEKAVAGFSVTLLDGSGCIGVIGISSGQPWTDQVLLERVKAIGQELSLICGALFYAHMKLHVEASRLHGVEAVEGYAVDLRRRISEHFSKELKKRLIMK